MNDMGLECAKCDQAVESCRCEDINDRMEIYLHSIDLIHRTSSKHRFNERIESALKWNKLRQAD